MLVVSRECGQSLTIGDRVLTLVRIADALEYAEASVFDVRNDRSKILILPRHERITLCENVQVIFLPITKTRARLGVEAPRDVPIVRSEL